MAESVWTGTLYRRIRFVLVIEGRRGLTLVSLLDVGFVVVKDDYIFFAFYFDIRCLDGAISALLTLALIELANRVDLSDHFVIDGDALFRVELLLVKHTQVKHLVLDF
jgi:hypothetical protein